MHNHYTYKVLEKSNQNIITLEDVKNYTRISTENDDELLESMINSAIQIAENFIKISLMRKVIEVTCDNAMNIKLPFVPVIEIIKVEADEDELDLGNIILNGESVSLAKYVKCTKLKVTYSAGHEDASLIPAPIRQGIMQHISNMYDTRGVGMVSIEGVLALYRPYRRMFI